MVSKKLPTFLSTMPQKTILDSERCNGCGECKISCPSYYIELK
ncbi:hypothetical protein FHQ25_06595 [Testudinibacter sp. TR-2022]|nr:hypothetical protein FHQ25_06595 [Testudinibacter sp. TR-2022]